MNEFEAVSLLLTNEGLATGLVSTLDEIDDQLAVLRLLEEVCPSKEREERITKLEIKKKILLTVKHYYYELKDVENLKVKATLVSDFRKVLLSV